MAVLSSGETIYNLIEKLYPFCRSITGNGLRQTLQTLQEVVPLQISEAPSGMQAFDWTIPPEWNIREAWIRRLNGEKVVDFADSNLHILNYSAPFRGRVKTNELKERLYTLPEHPDWIPYRTSYHHRNWGFCMSHNAYARLTDEEYDVLIDAELKDGAMTYAECYIPGKTQNEVLISCHTCHPSLCNDNLSGVSVAAYLAKTLKERDSYYSYRFLFIPATIGAIAWLFFNRENVDKIRYGIVATLLGDNGRFHYKKSRDPGHRINQIVPYALKHEGYDHEVMDFFPYGYDERQYCSPGFNLPVGCLMRTPHGQFPEYHTSADNLDFVKPEKLYESYLAFLKIFDAIESNQKYLNLQPYGEPQLGKRGLYQHISGDSQSAAKDNQMALLWLLNMSDGDHDLLAIAQMSGLPLETLHKMALILEKNELLKNVDQA